MDAVRGIGRAADAALLHRVAGGRGPGRLAGLASAISRGGLLWHVISAGLLLRGGAPRRIGTAGTAGWVAASTLDRLLKLAVGRRRPSTGASGPSTRSSSMPSSHSAAAAAYATAATAQHPAAAVLAAPAAVVAWSRLGTRRHFPTDVVAGALLGVAVGVGTGLVVRRATRPRPAWAAPTTPTSASGRAASSFHFAGSDSEM